MFADIPDKIKAQMTRLEEIDRRDRIDGTPHLERLRQIPPETGRLLAILAASAPAGRLIEIGTSAGYSTLWLALACRNANTRITTFEILDPKIALARETFQKAGVEDVVDLVGGDAKDHLADVADISFCFLDAEKDRYQEFYDLVIPGMVSGGLFIADNVISHTDQLSQFIEYARDDKRIDAVIVPIGKGVLLCRKI